MAWRRQWLGMCLRESLASSDGCLGGLRAVQALNSGAQSEDLEACEFALGHIDQPVVSNGICWGHEEPRPHDVVPRILDDSLDGLTIIKADANP